jgi:hypothetical protein
MRDTTAGSDVSWRPVRVSDGSRNRKVINVGKVRRRVASALAAGAMVAGAMTATAQAAAADEWQPDCNGNEYGGNVTVTPYSLGQWQINVTPTQATRTATITGDRREATDAIWRAVQNCVSGLYGELADSIYQQIDCHVLGAIHPGTGATFDLESWRPSVGGEGDLFYLTTQCGWGGYPYIQEGGPVRPDAGRLDLYYGNIA